MTLTELLENEEFRSGRKWATHNRTSFVFKLSPIELVMSLPEALLWKPARILAFDLDQSWRLVEPEKE